MHKNAIIFSFFLFLSGISQCQSVDVQNFSSEFTIAFGSCNDQNRDNILWKEILKNNPNLWIWGGDNIYADTSNMMKMKKMYQEQQNNVDYKHLVNSVPIMATWDDHDYGINDGGQEHIMKKESQQAFLDFLDIKKNDVKRKQEGVYSSKTFFVKNGSIKVIVLDTRYFRSSLIKSKEKGKRYTINNDKKASVLGEKQWLWLENELKSSNADFNVIVTSIQFLSQEHGFETWGNFPHEVEKLKKLLIRTKAKNPIILSGDRHISEFSKIEIEGLQNPLIDFTSSGLTHSYKNFKGEPNAHRVGKVVFDISFGLLKFNLQEKSVLMEMRGKENTLQQHLFQKYQ